MLCDMASEATNLATIRANALERLAELDANANATKLTYSLDGISVDYATYRRSLQEQVEWATKQLQSITSPVFNVYRQVRG